MAYEVLARKWRPRTFREMVGQQHVLKALEGALDRDRLHHAYLFTGTRGVGKTTVARILAKCLNCESGVSSVPCGQCSACIEIDEGRSVDLLEVDAASQTKVEDTRELLENVLYAPTRSRFKVYLIDEVHMLSRHSFNALLKTLEEPPAHVKFLLATTDPQKLPATVLSRCLQFNLKNMPADQIVGHLSRVLEAELVQFDEPALWQLARAAAGSMRDALSLTDQAIAYGGGALREADVNAMLGTVDTAHILHLLEQVAAAQPRGALECVAHMSEQAVDFEAALEEMISLLHRIAVAQVVPPEPRTGQDGVDEVVALGRALPAEDVQLLYQMALTGRRDLPLAGDARSGFEMIVLRMLAFRPLAVIDPSLAPQDLEPAAVSTEQTDVAGEVDTPAKKPCDPQPLSPRVAAALTRASWPAVWEALPLTGFTRVIASHCEFVSGGPKGLQFTLDESQSSLLNDNHVERLRDALRDWLGEPVTVRVSCGPLEGETPALRRGRLESEQRERAAQVLEEDPLLQKLLGRFDGQLDRSSIQPGDM